MEEFLRSGPAPIVFTAGTAMVHGKRFFVESLRATQSLGARAIFLSQFRDQLPKSLPLEVIAADFVPLGGLLQRAAAVVHHGGIGTTAQALAAGIPQLIVPMSFDQPDNAHRVEQLGVGRSVRPRNYSAERAAELLESLTADTGVSLRCEEVAIRCAGTDALRIAGDEIERLGVGLSSERNLRHEGARPKMRLPR
jgi:UDP:flavonoid glycosyltransferase YjiC (YdhE family)